MMVDESVTQFVALSHDKPQAQLDDLTPTVISKPCSGGVVQRIEGPTPARMTTRRESRFAPITESGLWWASPPRGDARTMTDAGAARVWTVAEAKGRLSEILRLAEAEGRST